MAKRIVLLTGGSGFIGSHVAEAYLHQGDRVIIADIVKPPRDIKKYVTYYNADLHDKQLFRSILQQEQVTVISHHAAIMNDAKYADIVRTNIDSSLSLINFAQQHGISHFIFASSAAVYGETSLFPTPESYEGTPLTPYGFSKKIIEDHLYHLHGTTGFPFTILRYANVYGPRQKLGSATPNFIDSILNNKKPALNGDGDSKRDFIYIDDVVEANIAVAAAGPIHHAINIGTGKATSIQNLLHMIQAIVGVSQTPTLRKAKKEISYSQLDIQRAKELLNWIPKTSHAEGLEKTIQWFKTARAL